MITSVGNKSQYSCYLRTQRMKQLQKIASRIFYSLILVICFQECSFNMFFYDPVPNKILSFEDEPSVREISLINKAKDTLSGFILEPVNSKEIRETVLLIHGNSGDISRWIENAKYLYDRNYRVLVFDYQGYGKSTGKPNHKNVVTDTELFLNHINSEYGKVILWGLSLGGNLSVNVAYRNPDKVKALIVEAGFTSHNQIARTKVSPVLKPFVIISVRSPYKSKKIIKELHMPVLIQLCKMCCSSLWLSSKYEWSFKVHRQKTL